MTKLSKRSTAIGPAWHMKQASSVKVDGATLTSQPFPTDGIKAIVPGTVLTSLVDQKIVKDPYFDTDNPLSQDISTVKPDAYTYWFFTTFNAPKVSKTDRQWLNLRGINYTASIYLNGHLVSQDCDGVKGNAFVEGMFRRFLFDVTDFVQKEDNRLAILVKPPRDYGTPGGNGGNPLIGQDVSMRYTVGWDWTQFVADRNTGIWDKISIETTGPARLEHPHVKVTKVTHKGGKAPDTAQVKLCVDVRTQVAQAKAAKGTLKAKMTGTDPQGAPVTLEFEPQAVDLSTPGSTTVDLPELAIKNANLWWPNGMGDQPLYDLDLQIELGDGTVSDVDTLKVGLRTFDAEPVGTIKTLDSRVFRVNGQRAFLRGGVWIGTDAMLRHSDKRYDDEIRMHKAMNLNMIRVWGGGITERPEFYDACDRHGILVMQEFWRSSEYQPRVHDNTPVPYLKVFEASAIDAIRMLRNHASLAFWCGGNELDPALDDPQGETVLTKTLIDLIDQYDGMPTAKIKPRLLVDRSCNIGGNNKTVQWDDGPYGVVDPRFFFRPLGQMGSSPGPTSNQVFDPETGNAGIPTADSVRRMMTPKHAKDIPAANSLSPGPNDTWSDHCFAPYYDTLNDLNWDFIYAYGDPMALKGVDPLDAYCDQAQLASFTNTKSLFEGANAKMWTQFSGALVWKSQTSQPALRAQLYDNYLQQTGGYYGARKACAAHHVQLNLDTGEVNVVNAAADPLSGMQVTASSFDLSGKAMDIGFATTAVGTVDPMSITDAIGKLDLPEPKAGQAPFFVKLEMRDAAKALVSRNVYWLPVVNGDLSGLRKLSRAKLDVAAKVSARPEQGRFGLEVTLANTGTTPAFALRLQARKSNRSERVLPVLYSDNYICIGSGDQETVSIDMAVSEFVGGAAPDIWLEGWNVAPSRIWSKK